MKNLALQFALEITELESNLLYSIIHQLWSKNDVLSEAKDEIEQYRKNFPEVYASSANEIQPVLEVMGALQRWFDTPPHFALRSDLNALGAAIRQLDLSAIRAAQQRLFDGFGELSDRNCQPEATGGESRNGAASDEL